MPRGSGSILDLMSDDIKATVASTVSELRKAEDRVRELRTESDRLGNIVAQLNAEIDGLAQRKLDAEGEVSTLDDTVKARLDAADQAIRSSRDALAKREGAVSASEAAAAGKLSEASRRISEAAAREAEVSEKARKAAESLTRAADKIVKTIEGLAAELIARPA